VVGLAAIAIAIAYMRRMQWLAGYAIVGCAGFAAAIVPSFALDDWLRGIGMGVSVALGLIFGLRLPYPRPGGFVRAGGRVARLDRLQLAELILVLAAIALWTFAPDSLLVVAAALTLLVLGLVALEPTVRRGRP
jgi:hypothetical protein